VLTACGGEQVSDGSEVQIEKRLELTGEPIVDRPVSVKIYRDTYGVPHVFADSNYGVYFGYGYAVAQDRLFQMEMLKRTAQGRVAEVLGVDYLELDKKLRTQYNHDLVTQQVESLSAKDLDILAGYAAGVNAYLEELAQGDAMATDLPKPFYDLDFQPTRWTAFDVASIFVGSIAHRYADFNSERDNLAFLRAMEARHGKATL
jgi:penicillin amidase